MARRKKERSQESSVGGDTAQSSAQRSGGAGMFTAPISRRPDVEYMSALGGRYTFSGSRVGAPYYSDIQQWVGKSYDYDIRGFHTPVTRPHQSSYLGPNEQLWDSLYVQLVLDSEDQSGYRHTPSTLANSSSMDRYINDFIKCVANARMLSNMFGLDGWNPSTFQITTALRATGSFRGRLRALLESLADIPMPPMFREIGVYYGYPVYSQPHGAVVTSVFTWDVLQTRRIGNWTPSQNVLNSTLAEGLFDPTASGSGADIDDIITDTEEAVKNLLGTGSGTPAFLADARAIRDLFEMLRYPKGLPALEGLVRDPAKYDEMLFRGLFGFVQNDGGGTDVFQWGPVLALPENSATAEQVVIRRGLGAEVSELYLAGLIGSPIGMAILGHGASSNANAWIDSAANLDSFIMGALRYSTAGVGQAVNGDTSYGWNDVFRTDNPEDNMVVHNPSFDMADLTSVQNLLGKEALMLRHDYALPVAVSKVVVEEGRHLSSSVDWEFIQPITTVGEINRRMVATQFGLSVV